MTERLYTIGEICELLKRARKLGFSLARGSELEKLTIAQLEQLVTISQ